MNSSHLVVIHISKHYTPRMKLAKKVAKAVYMHLTQVPMTTMMASLARACVHESFVEKVDTSFMPFFYTLSFTIPVHFFVVVVFSAFLCDRLNQTYKPFAPMTQAQHTGDIDHTTQYVCMIRMQSKILESKPFLKDMLSGYD